MGSSGKLEAFRGWNVATLGVAVLSLAVAGFALREARAAKHRACEELLADTWTELEPVMRDAGVKTESSAPRTVRELATRLRPLFEPLH